MCDTSSFAVAKAYCVGSQHCLNAEGPFTFGYCNKLAYFGRQFRGRFELISSDVYWGLAGECFGWVLINRYSPLSSIDYTPPIRVCVNLSTGGKYFYGFARHIILRSPPHCKTLISSRIEALVRSILLVPRQLHKRLHLPAATFVNPHHSGEVLDIRPEPYLFFPQLIQPSCSSILPERALWVNTLNSIDINFEPFDPTINHQPRCASARRRAPLAFPALSSRRTRRSIR